MALARFIRIPRFRADLTAKVDRWRSRHWFLSAVHCDLQWLWMLADGVECPLPACGVEMALIGRVSWPGLPSRGRCGERDPARDSWPFPWETFWFRPLPHCSRVEMFPVDLMGISTSSNENCAPSAANLSLKSMERAPKRSQSDELFQTLQIWISDWNVD